MATKNFKIRNGLEVNGNFILNGNTVTTIIDSDSIANVADTQFTVVNSGSSAYAFTGDGFPSSANNPTIFLQKGHTYHFNVNASGHPFQIRSSNGGSAYNSGVTNNGAQVGRVVFTVPMDAPDSLYYQCTAHSGMGGVITIGGGAGMGDSDLSAVAILRDDVDSDSIVVQQLRTDHDTLNTTVSGHTTDIQTINNILDSDEALLQTLKSRLDSDETQLQVINTRIDNLGGSTPINTTAFVYTATGNLDSEFSGADDNGLTLSYTAGKIDVFLNGILLVDTTDYIATNGSSVTLINAPDSDDVLIVKRFLGTSNTSTNLNISSFTFTATGNLDSDFSGSDDNGNTLGYVAGKIQVFLNGILQTDTVDYIATDGSTVTLVNAPDSDDVLTVIKYLGTTQVGFDSDQVVSIINENVVSGSVDSDVAAVAALRRDADSDSLAIQTIRGDVDSDFEAFNTRIAAFNGLTDSDLTTVSVLRNDLDSESAEIAALKRTQVGAISTDISGESAQTLDSFAATDYRAAKYFVTSSSADSSWFATELIVIHDGTNAYVSEYGTISTHDSEFVTFDVDISGGNVRLRGTPSQATGNVKAIRQHIAQS